MSTATDPHGPWSPLHCVKKVKKWEDPCPFWDEDGQAYLGRSKHGAGPIIIHKMSPDGRELLDDGLPYIPVLSPKEPKSTNVTVIIT